MRARPIPLPLASILPLALVAGCAASPPTPETIGPPVAYVELAETLTRFIEHERADKDIPAISIALVDDQEIVWAAGFGWEDVEETRPADASTVYRVGSISKLFTAIAVMQLVEEGRLDLDAPIQEAVSGFSIQEPFPEPITLRQLHAHRSGLVREPPVGSYFDPTEPGLEKTVASLHDTPAVYPPGERTKYSNAAVALAGLAVQRTAATSFERRVRTKILEPCGMESSSFRMEELEARLPDATMWTRDGREFPAPAFDLGIGPAGNLIASVTDLGRFLSMLFARGQGVNGSVLSPESLEAMYEVRWPDEAGDGYGVGFSVGELEGHPTVGHGGAVYGFSTSCLALPDERLGVVVAGTRDVSNAVVNRIAELAAGGMLAVRSGQPMPESEVTEELHPFRANRLEGSWQSASYWLDVDRFDGEVRLTDNVGDYAYRIRNLDGHPIVDDPVTYGIRLAVVDDGLVFAGSTFERTEPIRPGPCPERFRGLIGEYGWDHNTLIVFEDRGRLACVIEWFFRYTLQEAEPDRFRFPSFGLYHGEELLFERGPDGRATAVTAAGVRFERRRVGPEDGATFRIHPRHPVPELRSMAAEASPPREEPKREPELVDLRQIPGLRFDVRYATTNNFLGTALYEKPHAYLQLPAARALARAHRRLADQGYGLLIHDAFRPWRVTRMFWDATPPALRAFVADPAEGSRHNRGCAVDLTLFDLATGEPVQMVSGYDEFSPRSSPVYPGGTSRQRWHRDLLRRAMEAEGFEVYVNEWWHFDYRDWREYPILESFPEAASR